MVVSVEADECTGDDRPVNEYLRESRKKTSDGLVIDE